MPKIDVSVGELFDKLSILEIKKSKGLDVDIELDKLSSEYQQYNNIISKLPILTTHTHNHSALAALA